MSVPFQLGTVGLGRAARDPRASAAWYVASLGMTEAFDFEAGVAVESPGVTLVLGKGEPSPATLGHVSHHIAAMATLRAALAFLKGRNIERARIAAPCHPAARPRRLPTRALRAERRSANMKRRWLSACRIFHNTSIGHEYDAM